MQNHIISYNVNGIRSAFNKGFAEWIKKESPDIVCIQELKALPSQVDIPLFEHLGYNCYINSAEKPGYSGVAIFCKTPPLKVTNGLGIKKYDIEGRLIRSDFKNWTLINVYIPSGTTGGVRQDLKMEFLTDFKDYITDLRKKVENVLICGDFNICHKPIDINFPNKHLKASGFLPEEREWFDLFMADGLFDTFRMFNDKPDQYSWWSYRAGSRAKNLGWRIDYHIVSQQLRNNVVKAEIFSNVEHSDHCPVSVVLDI
jgi:exodeoxyribonuclease III